MRWDTYHSAWEPFEFWPYTTVVLERIFEYEPSWVNADPARQMLSEFEHELLTHFNEAGIKCGLDNKIAFGIKHKTTGQVLYFGFYDGHFSIGARVRSDGWNKPTRK